jgi:hypothetical protein
MMTLLGSAIAEATASALRNLGTAQTTVVLRPPAPAPSQGGAHVGDTAHIKIEINFNR